MRRERVVRAGGVAAALLLTVGCARETEAVLAQTVPCRVVQRLVPLPGNVPESSGVAVSRLDPTVFWTHNDSGGDPRIFAVDPIGELLGMVDVTGAKNNDWEDIESAPCADGNCLFIADIGDNGGDRKDIEIYRVPEPRPQQGRTQTATRFIVEYPEDAQDAEGFFVLPGERMYIVTKGNDGPIAIYAVPEDIEPENETKLEHIRDLSAGGVPLADRVTAASASPDGRVVGIRTRTALLLYDAEDLVNGEEVEPINVNLQSLGEPQGEGVAFGPNGTLVLTSEGGVDGAPGMLGLLWCPEQ